MPLNKAGSKAAPPSRGGGASVPGVSTALVPWA